MRYLVSLTIIMLLFSCNVQPADSPYDGLLPAEPLKDVRPPKVTVESMITANSIEISWQTHKYAEYHYLYRDTSPDGSFTERVFRGKGLSFVDTTVEPDTMYYYKVQYEHGGHWSLKSEYSFGVCSTLIADIFEPNDDEENAVQYFALGDSTIYRFDNGVGDVIADADYYYVTMPANSMRSFTMYFGSSIESGDILLQLPSGTVSASHGESLVLQNSGDTTSDVPFSVTVKDTVTSLATSYSVTLGSVIEL